MRETCNNASHEASTARWILGVDAETDQQYLVHTEVPAFIAKLTADEDEGVLSGLSYALSDGTSLYDFMWFGEVPAEPALRRLLGEADRAIQATTRHR